MVDVQVHLAADRDVAVALCPVGQGVEREGDGAVRRVLKGDDAVCGCAGLDFVKDSCRVVL